jgi:cob(I)alamin adenosyltransferase
MVTLNRIYTRTGDGGSTRLATGATVSKSDLRVETYGAVDETNACLGLARTHTAGADALGGEFDAVLARVQNELFDLGADLATPAKPDEPAGAMLRILDSQVDRLEREIDALNAELPPLASFVLPGGTPAAAALHQARTVCRRAEREAVRLGEAGEAVSPPALRYLNRLSDLLFVAARYANDKGAAEVFWQSGATR